MLPFNDPPHLQNRRISSQNLLTQHCPLATMSANLRVWINDLFASQPQLQGKTRFLTLDRGTH